MSVRLGAEGTALKAAWVSGDPLRRNAKSNVGATLLADAVTRASRQGPLIAAQEISTRESGRTTLTQFTPRKTARRVCGRRGGGGEDNGAALQRLFWL